MYWSVPSSGQIILGMSAHLRHHVLVPLPRGHLGVPVVGDVPHPIGLRRAAPGRLPHVLLVRLPLRPGDDRPAALGDADLGPVVQHLPVDAGGSAGDGIDEVDVGVVQGAGQIERPLRGVLGLVGGHGHGTDIYPVDDDGVGRPLDGQDAALLAEFRMPPRDDLDRVAFVYVPLGLLGGLDQLHVELGPLLHQLLLQLDPHVGGHCCAVGGGGGGGTLMPPIQVRVELST